MTTRDLRLVRFLGTMLVVIGGLGIGLTLAGRIGGDATLVYLVSPVVGILLLVKYRPRKRRNPRRKRRGFGPKG